MTERLFFVPFRRRWRAIDVTGEGFRPLAVLLALVLGCGGATSVDDPRASDDDAASDVATEDAATTDAVAEDGIGPETAVDAERDTADADADAGAPERSVLVYTNNIENMIFDWHDLVHFMARQPRKPDLFLVQQMTNKKRLDELLAFMTATLGEKYEGVAAQNDPTHVRFQDEVKPNPQVTTAIVWRAKRFNLLKQEKWFPWGTGEGGPGHTCDARTSNSGYQTLRVELDDVLAKKRLAAVSLRHWTWMDCSQKNMIEMIEGVSSGPNAHAAMPDHALQIVGGDFNGPAISGGDYRCWYRMTNHALGGEACSGHANLGFADPLYEHCKGDAKCFAASSGIDFLFGRRAGGKPARTSGWDIVTYEEGNAADKAATGSDGTSNKVSTHGFNDVNSNYSEHRARRAVFHYE